ncbi:MAG: hypothetical protein A2017_10220 [Lentisphaerae bacterium GWF2_44_16]|nr:MAG: hypothetical protein A2017_10220 [Lentisphaerae bacterium GWF2_44_16]
MKYPNLKKLHPFLIFTLFLFSVLCAFFARTWHYNGEADSIAAAIGDKPVPLSGILNRFNPFLRDNFVPFTIESAIMYSYTHDLAKGKSIAGCDKSLLGMDDIPVAGQMSLGLEYFLAYGYKLKKMFFTPSGTTSLYEDDPDFTNWIRFQIRLWTSLTAGFIFLWLIIVRCPWYFAIIGAMLHAFSPAAIARYTAQDLVRGEFCLPLITASFMLAYWAFRRSSPLKLILLGMTVFLAVATWDICQICFGLWAVFEIVRLLCGAVINVKRRNAWTVIFIAVVMAGLFVPYHQTHRLLCSPLIIILLPLILSIYFFGKGAYFRRLTVFVISLVFLCGAWYTTLKFNSYSGNYSHFAELMKAKIKYWNVKPLDPEKLNFDARMLWTPSMHSVNKYTWQETKYFIPYPLIALALLLAASVFAPLVRKNIRRGLGASFFPLFMTTVYFIAFIYIVRYHVFCVLFLSVALPLVLYRCVRSFNGYTAKLVVVIIVLFFLSAEIQLSFMLSRKYGIGGSFKESAGLIDWFRKSDMKDKNILADMTISPMLKAYCGAKILLQPQFELGKTRKYVEDYINIMFHGTEEELNKFCLRNGIEFLLYDYSYSYIAQLHIYSNRYMAAASKVNRKSPAYIMYHKPVSCKWFYYIEAPPEYSFTKNAYRLFKVISPADRMKALRLSVQGEDAYRKGNSDTARHLAEEAFFTDPAYEPCYVLYFNAFGKIPKPSLSDFAKAKP